MTKKWPQRYQNWDQVLIQLIPLYPERLTPYLQIEKGTKSQGRIV